MRQFFLFLFSLLIIEFAHAQAPTITSTSIGAGDRFLFGTTPPGSFTVPAKGANITWDYSAIVDTGAHEIDSVKAPLSTPYAAMFPAANLVIYAVGVSGYRYYQNNATNFSIDGFITPNSDTNYYQKPLSVVHFPFTYGSVYSDSTTIGEYVPGFNLSYKEVVQQTGTGYGTLKLPGGQVFSNVLQVTTKTTDYTFGTSVTSSILFLQQGSKFYLMSVSLGTLGNVSGVRYLSTGGTTANPTYTFTGTGNWDVAANWSGGVVPTSPIPSGTQVVIKPQAGGACILDVPVTFAAGSTLTVNTGAVFKINGFLTILK